MVTIDTTERADLGYGSKPTTLNDFVEGADHHYHTIRANTTYDYRVGQAYSNYFAVHFPESYRRIIATNTDPYYTEANLGRLLAFVVEQGCVSE